jgi:non-ribosomal peptide synthetase component F
MDTPTQDGREFWREVLLASGMTAVPRSARDPRPGVAVYQAPLPGEVLAGVRRLAGGLAMLPSSVLLAAHAKVLAVLSGERDVVTGYVTEAGAQPLACRLTTAAGTWRGLLWDVAQVESDMIRHRNVAVEELRGEPGVAEPVFGTEFEPVGGLGAGRDLADAVVLRVEMANRGRPLALRLRYRTDVLDAGCVARIAGYHLAALALMAADVDAEHGRQSLLAGEERQFEPVGLAGPCRESPGRRVHGVFERRARRHPDAVAVAMAMAHPDSGDRDDDRDDPPVTAGEVRLAAAWEHVLGIPDDQIGRRDHFFDLGGCSLSAVKLAAALNGAVSPADITRHPVLADLADLLAPS